MDEAEWLTCAEPEDMLTFLREKSGSLTVRKGRLFCCACCRRIWDLLLPEAQAAVAVAESHADGLASDAEIESADHAASNAVYEAADHRPENRRDLKYCDRAVAGCCEVASPDEFLVAYNAAFAIEERTQRSCPAPVHRETSDAGRYRAELSVQGELLRDLVGNPFRPIALDPTLRTSAVLALAQAAYDNRTLPAGTLEAERLAVLADALEDAGCTDLGVLGHLRGPGSHVRGCHLLDALLGKS